MSQCSDCWTDSDSFEPRDAVKGDVARMLFYMAIRYEGDDGFANLELNNSINGTTPWHGKISILLSGAPPTPSPPSRCAATTASTPPGRATATPSSTTQSGPSRSGERGEGSSGLRATSTRTSRRGHEAPAVSWS